MLKLLPKPQKMTERAGEPLLLDYKSRITLDASCPAEAYEYAKLLKEELFQAAGLELLIDRRMQEGHRGIRLVMTGTPFHGPESYRIEIDEELAVITAGELPGLFDGIQTMRQIIRQCGALLPALTIEDYPDLPVRGWFMDATRGRIPKLSYLKEMVDRCCLYKINQMHLYVEHTFLFDGFSEVWRDDTPLTAEDILELDDYCAKRGIDLVPSIATFGHLYKVLRTKSFSHLSEIAEPEGKAFSMFDRMRHHTLNVTDEEAYKLVCGMIDEYVALFRSNLFNINGDETFDLGKGRGKWKADEIGTHAMYLDWVNRVCEHVVALGKRPMFWGDIIASHPETIRELPENIICMTWDYGLAPGDDNVRKLWENGAHQYLCPGVQGWNQSIHLLDIAYANIRKMAKFAHQFEGEGLLVTDWGDYGHFQYPETALIGVIYAAAMGWNKEIPDEESLNEAVSLLEFSDRSQKLVGLIREISLKAVMRWGELVEFAEEYRYEVAGKGMERFAKEYLPRIGQKLPHIAEYNEEISRCIKEFQKTLPSLNPEDRRRVAPVVLMAEGQKLLNQVLAVMDGVWFGTKNSAAVDPKELAAELEIWYYEYRKLWHSVSRESELYRIGEVINWTADYLRGLNV